MSSPDVDLVQTVIDLYGNIIVNCTVGADSNIRVPFESETGDIAEVSMKESMRVLLKQTFLRPLTFPYMINPWLLRFLLSSKDRRYKRNINRLRASIQKLIDGRRLKNSRNDNQDTNNDLLTILISSEFFKKDDNLVIDEMLTFFAAGMGTIRSTTTNLICYMAMNPTLKSQLLQEILPVVKEAKENIVDRLSYESVMDLDFLQRCVYETLRIEPPIPITVL